jgi:hypothetical protein
LVAGELSNLQAAISIARQRQMDQTLLQTVRAFFLLLYEHGLWQLLEGELEHLLTITEQAADYDLVAEPSTLFSGKVWGLGNGRSLFYERGKNRP